MSEQVNPTGGTSPVVTEAVKTATPGVKGGAAAGYSSSTGIRTLEDLKEKAPEVWKQTMVGIATEIIGKMRRSQLRLKEIIRKGRQQ